MQVSTCVCVCDCVCVCVYVYVYMYIYAYIYTHKYIYLAQNREMAVYWYSFGFLHSCYHTRHQQYTTSDTLSKPHPNP